MNPFFLSTILPELYLDDVLTKEFNLPFNVSGIMIIVERKIYKPVWVTTSLLQLTKNEIFIKTKNTQKIEDLINNNIIPNFTLEDFKKYIDLAKTKRKEVNAKFSEANDWSTGLNSSIRMGYEPKFMPVFKKNNVVSHVLFYLEAVEGDKKLSLNRLGSSIIEIDRLKTLNNELFSINNLPLIEIDTYLKIENYNQGLQILFPRLKVPKGSNFLDIWSHRNQPKIAEKLFSVRTTQKEELLVFEELDDQFKKLKLIFKNVPKTEKTNTSVLVSIENLNQDNDIVKELTKKAFLLQCTQMLSFELEESETTFISKSSQYIIQNFDLNGMYFLEFNQESMEKLVTTFPELKKEPISYNTFESHKLNFQPLTRRNFKQILSEEVFTDEKELAYVIGKSPYLLGIPIYEQGEQIGIMVYSCDSKKIEIDSAYQLYSLTTIFHKIFSYQTRLSENKLKIAPILISG